MKDFILIFGTIDSSRKVILPLISETGEIHEELNFLLFIYFEYTN